RDGRRTSHRPGRHPRVEGLAVAGGGVRGDVGGTPPAGPADALLPHPDRPGLRRPGGGDRAPPADLEGGDGGGAASGAPGRGTRDRQDPPGRRTRRAGPGGGRCRTGRTLRRGPRRSLPTVRRGAPPLRHGRRGPPTRTLSRGADTSPPRNRTARRTPGRAAALGPRDRALPPLRRHGLVAGGRLRRSTRPARARRSPLGGEADAAPAPPRVALPGAAAAPRPGHIPRQRHRAGPTHEPAARRAPPGRGDGTAGAQRPRRAGHRLDDEEEQALPTVVWRETDGNPFFLGEVLRHLSESGAVEQRGGRWVLNAAVDELGIPEGVRDVVGQRLSRLAEPTNRVL